MGATRSSRPGFQIAWVVMSNARENKLQLNGKLALVSVSVFQDSHLYQRGRTLADLEVLKTINYINPCLAISRQTGGAMALSKSQRSKQWHTGIAFWDGIRASLFSRMPLTSAKGVMWVDVLPYDDKLQQSVILSHANKNPKSPTEAIVSVIWAKMGTCGPHAEDKVDNGRIESFLKKSLQLYAIRMIKEKVLKFDDIDVGQVQGDTAMKPPSIDAAAFVQTCPNTTGALPLRQDAIDLILSKVTLPDVKAKVEELIREHDKLHNPSGVPFKGGKRPGSEVASQADDDEVQAAIVYPPDASGPKGKDCGTKIHVQCSCMSSSKRLCVQSIA